MPVCGIIDSLGRIRTDPAGIYPNCAPNEVVLPFVNEYEDIEELVDEGPQFEAFVTTLTELTATPPPEDIAAAFVIAFSLPIIFWLVSGGYGVVINWFNHRSQYRSDDDEI